MFRCTQFFSTVIRLRNVLIVFCAHKNYFQSFMLMATVVALLGSIGCSQSEYRKVYGVVTVEGEPLEMGRVVFHSSQGRPAMGTIQPDGSYEMTTSDPGDGVKPGTYQVSISVTKSVPDGPQPKNLQEEMAGVGANTKIITTYLANRKYESPGTSELTATVKDSGSTEINFDLEPYQPIKRR